MSSFKNGLVSPKKEMATPTTTMMSVEAGAPVILLIFVGTIRGYINKVLSG
jgi:hypothetical protein